MSAQAIEFLQEWIGEKCCQAPARSAGLDEHAETLARECAADAAEAGIPLEDLQDEVGDIRDLISARLEDAVEAEQATGDAPARDRPAPASRQS